MFITPTEQKWFQAEYPVGHRIRLIWEGGEPSVQEGDTGTIIKNNAVAGHIIVKWVSGTTSKLFYGNFLAEVL